MRLTSITIENFKGIGKAVTIPVRPLTFLFGHNSAGKSTIFEALRFQMRILQGERLEKDAIERYLHCHESSRVITIGSEWEIAPYDRNKSPYASENQYDSRTVLWDEPYHGPSKEEFSQFILTPRTMGITVDIGTASLTITISYDNVSFAQYNIPIFADDIIIPEKPAFSLTYEGSAILRVLYGDRLEISDDGELVLRDSASKIHFTRALNRVDGDLSPLNDTQALLEAQPSDYEALYHVLPFIFWPIRAITRELESLEKHHVGPLRFHPESEQYSMPYGGREQWKKLNPTEMNPWMNYLKTGYQIETRPGVYYHLYYDQIERLKQICLSKDQSKIENFFKDMKRHFRDTPNINLKDMRTETPVGFADVGVGVWQLIPVLAATRFYRHHLNDYEQEDEQYVERSDNDACGVRGIEQPELHLHPAIQSHMGDLFVRHVSESPIEDASIASSLIIETHSEHIILRILRRIRETSAGRNPRLPLEHFPKEKNPSLAITPDDVSVIYVKATQERGTEVFPIGVTNDGGFTCDWPDGFFSERAEDLF